MHMEGIISKVVANQPRGESRKSELPNAFHWLWGGQSVSLVGSQLSALSFQLIAVTVLHASAGQMGVLTAAQTLPYLLFGLFVGVLVDNSSRRLLLVGTDLARFAVLIAASILALTGHLHIEIMWAVVCLIASFNLIFDAALGAYIPQLLSRNQWLAANSRLSVTSSASEVIGPGAAGYVLQVLFAPAAMLLDAVSYPFSAGCIALGKPKSMEGSLETSARLEGSRSRFGRRNIVGSVREGVTFVLKHPVLRVFALWSAVWNLSWSAVLSVFVLYATRTLTMTPGAIGLVFAVGGSGGVLGAAAAGKLAKQWSRGGVLVAAPFVAACGGLLVLAAGRPYAAVLTAVSLFVFNVGQSAFGVNMQTCRQEFTPPFLMGRMDTTMRLCFTGTASLGALAGGFIGSRFGLRVAIFFGISGLFVTVVGLKLSPLAHLVNAAQREVKTKTR